MSTLIAICGSLRKESWNKKLLLALQDLAPQGVTIEIITLESIPFYNADVEEAGTPQAVLDFKNKILSADGILIASPEYNYSIPGVLKNAIDWVSRKPNALSGKPVAIMGASDGYFGTARMQLILRDTLFRLNAFVLPQPEVYVPMAQDKFDENGKLTDERTESNLKALLETFLTWTAKN